MAKAGKAAPGRARRTEYSLELTDTSSLVVPLARLGLTAPNRDPASLEARLADQFSERNRAQLREIETTVEPRYDGSRVALAFRTQGSVGAVPLTSPISGQHDFGLVVRPRFEWTGLGPMLQQMGWRVIPQPLSLPLLPQSDRKTPSWVISAIVLFRLSGLLKQLERRFEIVEEDRHAPRGAVNWARYATSMMPRAQFLNVPCRLPDLRDDRALKSAIRYTLLKQLGGLESQRAAGPQVMGLIELATSLLDRVRDVPPREPWPNELDGWLRKPMRTQQLLDGIQAIDWTVNDRGLAGLSDLQGLAWCMSMDAFFEAWVEAVMANVAPRIGAVLRTGRKQETVAPIVWDPPYVGSQKSLRPDIMVERADETIILDAKYKEHWEEMRETRWGELEEAIRERHRSDLLQVLAYANLSTAKRIVVCLVYPCSRQTWESLLQRGRAFHRAALNVSGRRIDLRLTAMPMGVELRQISDQFVQELHRTETC